MEFLELQDEVKDLLNFNSGQTDQDFTDAQIKKAVNRAYTREVNRARQEGSRAYFLKTQDISWSSGDVTLTLPSTVNRKALDRVLDITNSNPGYEILFDNFGFSNDVFWKDNQTLQWGSSGPGEDKTLRVEYLASATELVADDDEPTLLPPEYHELLVWSAAIDLRRRADEASPGEWQAAYRDLQTDFWKHVSRGRPHRNVVTIGSPEVDDVTY